MANIKILLADVDDKYLMPLERKFIDGMEEKVELIVITDPDYLNQFFSIPQKLDILIINEELYDTELERHNIANIFILMEQEQNFVEESDTNRIFKYTSVKEIYNEVINKASTKTIPLNSVEEAKILMIYSPIGGIGKTTISAALCEAIAKYHKKVLFVGIDNLQTFGSVIEDLPSMEGGAEKLIIEKNEYVYDLIKSNIISRTFDILPPFHLSLPSMNVKGEDYYNLIHSIKRSKDYDYIVIDGISDFTEDVSRLMGIANHTIIIASQDKNATYKLDCLLRNIDCSDPDKFIFVCNKFRSDKENLLISSPYADICIISEYIEDWSGSTNQKANFFSNHGSIKKLALMFI